MKTLVVIPARGGSKGIPLKNIKDFCGKPLICYSIDIAREIVRDADICVSTDDDEIIKVVEDYGLKVLFKRPYDLSTDTASTNDVLMHAINYYQDILYIKYDRILLLQPTSPLRTVESVVKALNLFSVDIDMVVSVKKSHSTSTLCKENKNGFIDLVFNKKGGRRQDFDSYYEYTGSIYVINVNSFKVKKISEFSKIKKSVDNEMESIDIDTPLDWVIAESIFKLG